MTSLPGSPWLQRQGAQLVLDGCSLDELATRFGTPLFVYSQRAMEDAAQRYLGALKGHPHLLCYAMKANSTLAVLQTFARLGLGFDIVSGGELLRALAAGASPDQIVFSGVGKTAPEISLALEHGVRCFNVESTPELERLAALARAAGRTARISLRVNPDVDAGTHPYISTGLKNNKFGIAHREAVAAYRRAAELEGLQVDGIDCHIGSQITQIEPYLDALDRLLDLVESVERAGITLHHVDIGGGLGITYDDETPPDASELIGRVLDRLRARGHGHRTLLMEPGRSLVGNAGVLLTEVQYLKHGEAKNFCIVDAAMNDLLRPAMYQAWMRVEACTESPGAEALTWDVVGPVCESGDWLARDRQLALQPGARLAILSAGAYGMSMASNYNSRGRAAEVMVRDGHSWLVRERENPAHLFAGERLLDTATLADSRGPAGY
ncbi:MAG: diaminopimelate decarboxylase [Rubrivivax sp.]|jgi:diaminopimelate decarboxylase|nr:diaminopimelate decarboxylase [Rubrivivax sp.]